jgi:hypothetical protein
VEYLLPAVRCQPTEAVVGALREAHPALELLRREVVEEVLALERQVRFEA